MKYKFKYLNLLGGAPGDNELVEVIIAHKGGEVASVKVHKNATVLEVKEEYQKKQKVPSKNLSLTFNGKELINNTKISDYGIEQDSVLEYKIINDRLNTIFLISQKGGKIESVDVSEYGTVFSIKKAFLKKMHDL